MKINKTLFYAVAYVIMILVHVVGSAFDEDYKESTIYTANILVIIIITFFSNDCYRLELRRMNKYEKALADVANETVDRLADGYDQPKTVEHFHSDAVDTLRELVKRETPKRPYVGGFNPDEGYPESGFYCCPNCCERIAWFDLSNEKRDYKINHCFYCGQTLD